MDFLKVFAVLLLSLLKLAHSGNYNDSVQLARDMLADYDTRQRPVTDQTQSVNVSLDFHLIAIQEFDEVAEKFSVFALLLIYWEDHIIRWDPQNYGGISAAVFKLSDIWYPKLVLIKPYEKLKDIGDDWMTVRISSSGYTSFAPGAVFESSCSVDVTYYPFDTQICSIAFNIWGYVHHEVVLANLGAQVGTSIFTENGEWSLVSTSATRVPGTLYKSDEMYYTFTMKRKSTFLLVNIILPIIFLTFINLLVFLLPAESGERVSFSVTILLALAVFMTLVGDNLPKTSEPMPVFSFYLMCMMVMSTLMTVTTILNLKLYFKNGRVPPCFESLIRFLSCSNCRHKNNTSKCRVSPVKNGKTKILFKDDDVVDTDDVAHHSGEEEETEITWHYVTHVIDRICLTFFLTATFIVNTTFLVILVYNK